MTQDFTYKKLIKNLFTIVTTANTSTETPFFYKLPLHNCGSTNYNNPIMNKTNCTMNENNVIKFLTSNTFPNLNKA